MMNPPKVLIVEDNSLLRKEITGLFSKAGYQTIAAADGEEGMSLAFAEHPELISTDYNMPGINGLEMLVRIREKMQLPKVMMYSLHKENSQLVQKARETIPGIEFVDKAGDPYKLIEVANKLTGYSFEEWLEKHG